MLENVTYNINKREKRKETESVPHKDILDLKTLHIKSHNNAEDGRNIVIELNNETIETVDVSLDELDAATRKNTSKHGFIVMEVCRI